jgi:hypothetical protein
MKISIGKIAFILVSLIIVVMAYLPALHINLVPSCMFGSCKSITADSQIHVYGGPIIAQWEISQFDVGVGGSASQTMSLWFSTGKVCAVYRLYGNNMQLQSGTVCDPNPMDYALLGSTWDSSWTFSGISAGTYSVGVTYYEDGNARTNEMKKEVVVS